MPKLSTDSDQPDAPPHDLVASARAIVATSDLAEKIRLSRATAKAWFGGILPLGHVSDRLAMPDRPGRPAKPDLMLPRHMPKRAAQGHLKGRIALLHALAHIELNAVDMTWDDAGCAFVRPIRPQRSK